MKHVTWNFSLLCHSFVLQYKRMFFSTAVTTLKFWKVGHAKNTTVPHWNSSPFFYSKILMISIYFFQVLKKIMWLIYQWHFILIFLFSYCIDFNVFFCLNSIIVCHQNIIYYKYRQHKKISAHSCQLGLLIGKIPMRIR